MYKVLFLFVLIFGLSSCKTKQKLFEADPTEVAFSITKGGCFGKCPIYVMEIYGEGKAVFTGERDTEKLGVHTRQLGELEYKALQERIAAMNIRQYQDEYESMVADLPTVVLGARDAEGMKMIKGKDGRPDDVLKLQTILENLAESSGWTAKDPTPKKKEEDQFIKSEIIVEPGPGTLLPHFFKRLKETYGVRLLNRVSPNGNAWIITYNDYNISGDELLEALKNDKDVKFAEFNKKTTLRSKEK